MKAEEIQQEIYKTIRAIVREELERFWQEKEPMKQLVNELRKRGIKT